MQTAESAKRANASASNSGLRAKALLKPLKDTQEGRMDVTFRCRSVRLDHPVEIGNRNVKGVESLIYLNQQIFHMRGRQQILQSSIKPRIHPTLSQRIMQCRHGNINNANPSQGRATNANRRVQPSAPSNSRLRAKALLKPLKDPQEGRTDVTFMCRSVRLDHPVEIGMET
ncbi:hypothetical protein CDAR_480231 [Caerostris darwini]|uniref:Uncharacterized protein n=1 Tax=Caerostris darwini TaxID=1538125 RepID=A0AAV4V112_9ARAC|nr:hypothetical protein CDAR_480231 [Caerostris darwini]